MKEVVARSNSMVPRFINMVPRFRNMVAAHIPLWYGLRTPARADMAFAWRRYDGRRAGVMPLRGDLRCGRGKRGGLP